MTRDGLSAASDVDYVIGSGRHAYGGLVRVGDYLFQAPIAFYVQRGMWGVAPGFESAPALDFGRPVTPECLSCHSGHPRPVADKLNQYENPPFSVESISCDRCHGDAEAHLRNPERGNIVNPANLSDRARDSVCEQCHLSGEIRIINPGRRWGDFKPGRELEEFLSVYIGETRSELPGAPIKVIGHSEQLALSTCARGSGTKLWCGTCHDPHDEPAQPISYYRDRCLACHGQDLLKTHAKPADNCIGCHMPKRETKDGAHTVFTDHRIARFRATGSQESSPVTKLRAWREPRAPLALRNLGLANIEFGRRAQSPALMGVGANQVAQALKAFPDDPVMLDEMGLVLLAGRQTDDAVKVLAYALKLAPESAGAHVNLGNAYQQAGFFDKAITELNRAIELDPSFQDAYRSLETTYLRANNRQAARETLERYLKFMPQSITARSALAGPNSQ